MDLVSFPVSSHLSVQNADDDGEFVELSLAHSWVYLMPPVGATYFA